MLWLQCGGDCPFVWFSQRFGLDRALALPELASFSQSQYMTLDAVTLRDLEVCMLAAACTSKLAAEIREEVGW